MSKSKRVMIKRRNHPSLVGLLDVLPPGAAARVFSPDQPIHGYHVRKIERGVFGDPSKVREEAEEFLDACDQNNPVMALVELSDLLGAVRGYLTKHHPSVSFEQLVNMTDATERAFKSGHR